MRYRCSHCHHRFATEGEAVADACPACKAEAGLELETSAGLAMKLFGVVVVGVLVVSTAGALVSVFAS